MAPGIGDDERDGEASIVSRLLRLFRDFTDVRLTKRRESIVIRTQAQEQEQRDKPDANSEKGRNVPESRSVVMAPGAVPVFWRSEPFRLVGFGREMEEPGEMVCDDEST